MASPAIRICIRDRNFLSPLALTRVIAAIWDEQTDSSRCNLNRMEDGGADALARLLLITLSIVLTIDHDQLQFLLDEIHLEEEEATSEEEEWDEEWDSGYETDSL